MMISRNPISRKSDHQTDKNDIQLRGMRIFMDRRVATDNVIDTTISHNTGSKLLDNVIINNSHTTWNSSANKVPFSNKCLCVTSYINDMKLETLMSNNTINVEHTLVKDSSQIPRCKHHFFSSEY